MVEGGGSRQPRAINACPLWTARRDSHSSLIEATKFVYLNAAVVRASLGSVFLSYSGITCIVAVPGTVVIGTGVGAVGGAGVAV